MLRGVNWRGAGIISDPNGGRQGLKMNAYGVTATRPSRGIAHRRAACLSAGPSAPRAVRCGALAARCAAPAAVRDAARSAVRWAAVSASRCVGLGAALLVVFVFVAATASAPARAAEFPGLYTLTVEIDPAAQDPRAAAIEEAMRRLLVRLTGDRLAGEDATLAPMVDNAERFLDLYASVDRGARAQITFLRSDVERQLAALNRPVWGSERPLTLFWLTIDPGEGDRVLLSADGAADVVPPQVDERIDIVLEEIRAVAEERALPVAFPLLDLEDLTRVSSTDVWGRFTETVQAASERYGANAVVVGQIAATPFGTSATWTLARGAEQRTFAGGTVSEAVHWLADTFAQDFSVAGDQGAIRLVVRDVTSLEDYGRVMRYLESLSIVQSVDVEALDGDMLTLRAVARGDAALLARTLGLGRTLTAETNASPLDNTLVLHIVRGSGP